MNIAIVEDDLALLDSLSNALQTTPNISSVHTYSTAEAALEEIPQLEIDVVLMDINLPGINGVECVAKLITGNSELKILMHTVFEDSDDVFAALRAGALSYILKRTSFPQLLEAIEATYAGEAAMTPRIARHLVRDFQSQQSISSTAPENGELEDLTDRESEILGLVAKGYQNKEIARELDISADTVRVHLRNVYAKWQVSNRTQAVTAYLANKN